VFTLGYGSGHTLSGQESDSGLYREGSIFGGSSGGPGRKGAIFTNVWWKSVFKRDPGKGSKHTILGWSGKWCFGCLPLRYSIRV